MARRAADNRALHESARLRHQHRHPVHRRTARRAGVRAPRPGRRPGIGHPDPGHPRAAGAGRAVVRAARRRGLRPRAGLVHGAAHGLLRGPGPGLRRARRPGRARAARGHAAGRGRGGARGAWLHARGRRAGRAHGRGLHGALRVAARRHGRRRRPLARAAGLRPVRPRGRGSARRLDAGRQRPRRLWRAPGARRAPRAGPAHGLLAAGCAVRADAALPRYIRDKVAQTTAEREAARRAAPAPHA